MKKYPIYYQGKEYEVRWENETYCGTLIDEAVVVYEVLPRKILKYKKLDEFYTRVLNDAYDLTTDDEDIYIQQATCAVELTIKAINIKKKVKSLKETQKQRLQEWDGVIE